MKENIMPLQRLDCVLAPSDEGAVERSETEGEKKTCSFKHLSFLSFRHGNPLANLRLALSPLGKGRIAVPPSRLPPRSVLLLRNGVHRTPAPSSEGGDEIHQTPISAVKKKKVCFFSGDITRSGGTERVSIQLANALKQEGTYDICFVSLTEQPGKPFYPLDPEIKRYHLGEKWINPGPEYLPLIGKLRRFIKEQKIDIIIDIDIVLDVLSIPAVRWLKTKVVSWEHFNCEFEQSVLYRRLISKLTARFADYIITLTEEDKNNYKKILGRKKRIRAIYNMPTKMQRNEAVPKENIIVSAGRLTYQKGTEYLARVAVTVLNKHSDWKWLVLGDGEERNLLEEAIAENGLENRLVLEGTVDSVEAYLEKAKLFVLTSRYEGFGMCLVEALQMQVPCVSFDVKVGPSEIISDGQNGILIPPFDCEKMTCEIDNLIEIPNMLKEMSENALIGFERFSESKIIENWKKVFNEL